MDSQHRHELQQNDLAEFLSHFQDWWEEHGFRALLYVLVILVVVFGVQNYKARQKAAHDQRWNELDSATSPAMYEAVARTYDEPVIGALARLRGADLALSRAVGRKAEPMPDAGMGQLNIEPAAGEDDVDPDAMLTEAEAGYNAVLAMPDVAIAIKLNAMLGLASVAESRRDFDAARQTYDDIQAKAGPGYENFADMAKRRAAALDRIAEPVVLGKDPQPEPDATAVVPTDTEAEAETPTTQPAGAE